jgi:hypothetical protein
MSKKSILAVSMSILVILSQAGCGGSGGSTPAGVESGSGTTATGGTGTTGTSTAPGATTPAGGTTDTGATTTTNGSTPTGGAATGGATAGVAKLTWNGSQPGVSGFKVYYGTSPKSYSSSVDVGMVSTYTVSLPAGTYYFAVTAYDAVGSESDFSNEATKLIP